MSKMADLDIERQEIAKEAAEMGFGGPDLKVIRTSLEDFIGQWNGEDSKFIAFGEIFSEDDVNAAQELIERIDALV